MPSHHALALYRQCSLCFLFTSCSTPQDCHRKRSHRRIRRIPQSGYRQYPRVIPATDQVWSERLQIFPSTVRFSCLICSIICPQHCARIAEHIFAGSIWISLILKQNPYLPFRLQRILPHSGHLRPMKLRLPLIDGRSWNRYLTGDILMAQNHLVGQQVMLSSHVRARNSRILSLLRMDARSLMRWSIMPRTSRSHGVCFSLLSLGIYLNHVCRVVVQLMEILTCAVIMKW